MEKTITLIEKPEDTIKIQAQLVVLMGELKQGKTFDCIIQEHKEKRSKNANDYFHLLVHKIAEKLKMGNEETKIKMNLEYGTPERLEQNILFAFQVPKGADVSRVCKYAKWYQEIIDNGIKKDCYIVYKETHTLNTAEMSRLIDGVVQEAKDLGIETKTPKELAELKSLWGTNEKHNTK